MNHFLKFGLGLFVLLALALSWYMAFSQHRSKPAKAEAEQAFLTRLANVNKVTISWIGNVGPNDDGKLKVITGKEKITQIIQFTDTVRSQPAYYNSEYYFTLKEGLLPVPRPFISLVFENGEDFVFHFGFDGDFTDLNEDKNFFFSTQLPDDKFWYVSQEQAKKFLAVIDLPVKDYIEMHSKYRLKH